MIQTDVTLDWQRQSRTVAAFRALPGVESAAAANSLAVIGSPRGGTSFHWIGTPELPMNDRPSAVIRVVTPATNIMLRETGPGPAAATPLTR